jgi:hypothetical protein
VPALAVLASASLYIYLTHFEVYRATDVPVVNLALGIGVGLAAWAVSTRLSARLGVGHRRHRTTTLEPVPATGHRSLQEASR